MEDIIEVTEIEESNSEELVVSQDPSKLVAKLLSLSQSKDITKALIEWRSPHFYYCIDGRRCGCDRHNTKECQVLRNTITGKYCIVARSCVLQLAHPSLTVEKKLFSAIARVLDKKGHAHASSALVQFALNSGRITTEIKDNYIKLVTGHGGRTKFIPGHEHYNETAIQERLEINRLIVLGLNKKEPRCECKRKARATRSLGVWTYDKDAKEYSYHCNDCDCTVIVNAAF